MLHLGSRVRPCNLLFCLSNIQDEQADVHPLPIFQRTPTLLQAATLYIDKDYDQRSFIYRIALPHEFLRTFFRTVLCDM